MFIRKILGPVFVAGIALMTLNPTASAGTFLINTNFEAMSTGTWAEGTVRGGWRTQFDGYGRVQVERAGTKVLSLKPKVSTRASETHAALVTSKKTFSSMEFSARAKTVRQLREGKPNPWESAWLIWNYKDNTHFYYLALKPNGWEVGKADPAYPGAQRFLATGSDKRFPVGTWSSVEVRQVGATMTVWADGKQLTTFTDTERPYTSGSVGFYNEDAKTIFDNVSVVGV